MEDQEKQSKSDTESLSFQVIDKRHFFDLENIDKTALEEKPRYPSYVEELLARTAETERRFEEKKKQIDEEISRTKTRLEGDYQRRLDLEKQKMVLPFLEVLDNFQRAIEAAAQTGTIEHLLEGIKMTANLFRAKLESIGVEAIQAVNLPFNPNLEQAIGTVKVPDESLDGIVVEEVQPGYSMDGQLLRPAQVRVGRFE